MPFCNECISDVAGILNDLIVRVLVCLFLVVRSATENWCVE